MSIFVKCNNKVKLSVEFEMEDNFLANFVCRLQICLRILFAKIGTFSCPVFKYVILRLIADIAFHFYLKWIVDCELVIPSPNPKFI